MGLFYTTFTTYGPNATKVVSALKALNRIAFASPTVNGFTVVYDQKAEEQDFAEIEDLGKMLSQACDCPVLGSALHDDDVLFLWLFQGGKVLDFYNSLPQYFDPDAEPGPPEGGDSVILSATFGQPEKKEQIEKLLRANLLDDELPKIAGELERHRALIRALGMQTLAAEVTFSSIEGNYLPGEFREINFVQVGT